MHDDPHAGRTERAIVDQSAANGWNPIGRYAFAAGAGQSVRLDDNTGEAFSDRVRPTFDALRVTPTTPGPIDAGTPRDATAVDEREARRDLRHARGRRVLRGRELHGRGPELLRRELRGDRQRRAQH